MEKGIKRYSLSRQVSDQLEKMIEEGVYAVGEKIPTEPELTDMFSVSRNTIREAIQSLTSAGILLVKQGDGTYVRSNNRFRAHMSMEYDKVSQEDVLEARNAMEVTIAYLAAKRRTEEDLDIIEKALIRRQETAAMEKENTRADVDFHIAIAHASHNKILIDLYSSIADYMENHIAQRQAQTDMDHEQIDKLHENLYIAIRDSKLNEAGNCAKNILEI